MTKMVLVLATTIAAVLAMAPAAHAVSAEGAVIGNGTLQLGITELGSLNYECASEEADPTGCPADSLSGSSAVGLRWQALNADGTSPGCVCEGWGFADATSGLTGFANEASGDGNLTVDSFTADAQSAVSTVTISDAALPNHKMQVTHDYHPSPRTPNMYEALVTVTNTGTEPLEDLRYRRAMDWDVEPTPFEEWVTIAGSSDQLLFSSDNGFATSDPLDGPSYEANSEAVCGTGFTGPCFFQDLGDGAEYPTATEPYDHGALFDFGFGRLAPGETKRFFVLYGAAPNETEALEATQLVGAEVYSLGQPNCPETAAEDPDPSDGDLTGCDASPPRSGVERGEPVTFIFGFVTSTADLGITHTGPATAVVGSEATYEMRLTNTGPDRASGVRVTDTLPAGLDLVAATPSQGTCATADRTLTCDIGTIPRDGGASISLRARTTAVGDLTNTAVAEAASADPDLANNQAAVTTKVTAIPPPPTTTGSSLDCARGELALIDVFPRRSRVHLLGETGTSNAGRTVDFVFAPTGRRVAQATVRPDGSFQATAPLPARSIRNTSRARYFAVLGTAQSERLKLLRRVVVSSLTASGGRVRVRGRIRKPLARPVRRVTVEQRISCTTSRRVASFRPRKSGRFKASFPAPTGQSRAVYVLRTHVRRGRKLFLTRSLPRPVALG